MSKQGRSILDNSTMKPTKDTVSVSRFGQMGQNMWASGFLERLQGMADLSWLMEMLMRVSGKREKLMDTVIIIMQMAHCTWENGLRINSKG